MRRRRRPFAAVAVVARGGVGRLRKQISSSGRKASRSAPMSTKAASSAGMNAVDDALVDVALEVLAAERLDLERFENPVGDDADPALLRVGHVDQHDLWHENPFRPLPR